MSSSRVLCALLLILAACTSATGAVIPGHPNVIAYESARRTVAPSFTQPAVQGPAISSSSIEGSVAVVNFWGSWCDPCRREEPILSSIWKTYGARGVKFIGVDERDQKAAALAFVHEFQVPYQSVFDPSSEMSSLFHVHYMPATYVIDKQGRIAGVVIGGIQKSSDLTTLLDGVLA
jgi:thiol-disulfide isomerase/thioredoxin